MKVEFMYSHISDLVYHMLAHMPVNNASNLYSEEYISKINQEKAGRFEDITDDMGSLANYYNRNFERLSSINFMPANCRDLNSFVVTQGQFAGFNHEDRAYFLQPFVELLQKEDAFYSAYWKGCFDQTLKERKELETYLTKEWEKYKVLGSYFQKERAVMGLSYSMTRNGRGLGGENVFCAIVPFAVEEKDYKNIFLQILHEYTHQFTDTMLQQDINMEDGSHDFSENLVILCDYYLIKTLCPEDIDAYLRYLSPEAKIGGLIMTEEILLAVFEIPAEWRERLQQLVKDICLDKE